ncbi:hypothetical protein [Klebsiella pasteurii]|uniref:hypothetical protein n=1 Tax=Klebsiella pasteurii TaxID=2587529 RepID=UPI001BAD9890|nr:hypothetical protein [Klebsiella pasteurii]QUE96969.1 hypothetical protein KCG39_02365 [Klebsiella pasteurii]HBK4727425.1 hypothetical protein [Klebsiella michiganensis]HBM2990167.1 hypothetical protein [Klebsiella michiganensis]HDK6357775.1 hypothetical protein [Klebsiella variicola]
MIKFIDSISSNDPQAYMNGKLIDFWEILNPRKVNGDLKKISICKKLSSLLEKYQAGDYLGTVARGCRATEIRHIQYLEYLERNDYQKLKAIVLASPNELDTYVNEAFAILHRSDISILSNGVWQTVGLGKLLSEDVFSYSSFRKSDKCISFYKSLGIDKKHCLYCGDAKLNVISKEVPNANNGYRSRDGKILFDLDHFYLKSRYPFLSMSFYNLVPCCGLCNSRYRSTKNFDITSHINPYFESFDDNYFFEFDQMEVAIALRSSDPHLEKLNLSLRPNAHKVGDITARDLCIEERYQEQLHYINSLFKEIIYYSDKSWDEIEFIVCGVDYDRIPNNRKNILDVSMAKFKMDFLDMIKPRLDL